jgi:hypothetical protein
LTQASLATGRDQAKEAEKEKAGRSETVVSAQSAQKGKFQADPEPKYET